MGTFDLVSKSVFSSISSQEPNLMGASFQATQHADVTLVADEDVLICTFYALAARQGF